MTPKQKRRQAFRRKLFLRSAFPYLTVAIGLIILFMAAGCAIPKKKDAPHSYRVELGKKCVEKKDGTVAWSYVWIARDDVVLVSCE